ncbi:hypothetical protein M3Y94_01144600 [Aphelenchoides besseyi]|nr:hypothetical protein M3Y94_01144600 [Aphelenchoides besseyi]KAI6227898.1 hypothetical protein M3Y95_00565300 [Aphelenchoides besseyi]
MTVNSIAQMFWVFVVLVSYYVDASNDSLISSKNSSCRSDWQEECENGECVDKVRFCNGVADCSDGSDESYCVEEFFNSKDERPPCKGTWFTCRDSLLCVRPNDVCDGRSHCKDGSDEGPHCQLIDRHIINNLTVN